MDSSDVLVSLEYPFNVLIVFFSLLSGRIKGRGGVLRQLKEAFYKAIHPLICRCVGFQEAEVTPHENGTGDPFQMETQVGG